MKKYIFIIFLSFFIVLASGCIDTGSNNQTQDNSTYKITDKDSKTKHYDDNEISFDYPNIYNANPGKYSISLFNQKKQITIEKPSITAAYRSESISGKNTVSATTPLPTELVSNGTITIDGLNAQKIIYKNKGASGPSRIEITFNKNGKKFKIYLSAPENEFNDAESDLNIIINSLKIK